MAFKAAVRTALTLVLTPVAGVIAQAPESRLTLRVNTQLVQVSVVVKDSHGNPVTDLKASDFSLYDKGKKQEIRVFHVEDYQPAGAVPPATTAPAPSAPTAHTFSNRTPAEPGAPNVPTVIVIDAGNTWDIHRMTWQDLVYARDQVIQFLRQVHPEDRLGIYLMGSGRFWILHEYTQNCADLLERLASWKPSAAAESGSPKGLDAWSEFAIHFAGVDAETAKAMHRGQFGATSAAGSSALQEGFALAPGDNAGNPPLPVGLSDARSAPAQDDRGIYLAPGQNSPLAVLEAVANRLAAVPGRKNVVLISGKMFLPPELKDRVKMLRTIIQDGVSVYAIDPGGLAPYALDASFGIPGRVTMGGGGPANPDSSGPAKAYMNQHYEWKRQVILRLQSSLTELAETTGGKVFLNNDIQGAIRSSFEDSRVTYTLGFYPKTGNDGSFHSIKVKLPGREHLTVRAREGYFEPEPLQRDAHRREAELRQVVWSPVDASAIELSGMVSPGSGADGPELLLRIGLAAVNLVFDGDRWNGQIEVNLFQRDNSGNTYEPTSQTVGLNLRQDGYDKAVKSGFPYVRSFKIDPKAASLRVIVRDLGSSNLGTLTIPLQAARSSNDRRVTMVFDVAVRTALTLALVPVPGAIAQTPGHPVTLRVNTQLVQVSVVVKDSHGDPVNGLKASDFELYDKGKRQEIRVFNVEDYHPADASQLAATAAPASPIARQPAASQTGRRWNPALSTRRPSF